jgi:hypothetical protein
MKKAMETLLANPATRDEKSIKNSAYDQTAFTPWAGDED